MGEHLVKHGDGVKDIAFTVQDCDFLVQVSTTAVNAEVFSQIHVLTHTLASRFVLLHRKPGSEAP